jgi:uncharacterized protein
MPFPNVPGVQIQEVRLAPPPIFGVGTSTAGFVGFAPGNGLVADMAPQAITSVEQFVAIYMNGTTRSNALTRAVFGFFGNGGNRCYIVHTASGAAADLVAGIQLLAPIDDVSMIAAPGSTDATVYAELRSQAESTQDRIAIFDPPARVANKSSLLPGGADRPPESVFGTFYYPRVVVGPAVVNGRPLADDVTTGPEPVTPVGHIAGIYSRVDTTKGVHKAPANEVVRGVVDVEDVVGDADQDTMNPKGVNVLRVFGGNVVVWGARTLQDNENPIDTSFNYINVRRLVSYIAESLDGGLRYVVFEPNTLAIRQQITRSVRGFLDGVWRDGGLFGETPAQAYYVRFPPMFNRDEDRAAGKLTLEVGLRVTFPAEFVIVRIGVILQDPTAG